ncbi:DUF1853 family protein [Enterovibrio nigricans]|uniref:DUF1853 domain-containing protein n=1 Tax=Enterovibrio nigricans DSM 22720 TaxID=1121868 RepID=A0A1T4V421_9GAMM|nr:DUF1853 family protein [Enterovibrio nigricans]PKF50513.1 DUF1853 domain-containing protein [Enterovibrio nigricans]SKA59281.1 hypothetical protein SAMN02745132_03104 [Enterovibrio nigricans DSM 22720]
MFADKYQVQRDLAWIRHASSVVELEPSLYVPQSFWRNLPKMPSAFYEGGHRIGFYYQWLVQQCLNASLNHTLVAEEIQVEEDGRTIGAIDFVVRNSSNELEHWEVAIKFYLAFGDDWHGPNAKDTLSKKLSKMLSQQLALSSTNAYQRTYPDLPISKRKLLMQGRLFVNPFLTHEESPASVQVNPDAVSGFWCWPHQAPENKRFYLLSRHQWMCAPDNSELPFYSLDKDLRRAVHLIDENRKHWFIVPENWPDNSE